VEFSIHCNRNTIRPWGMFGGGEGANTELRFKLPGSDEWLDGKKAFGANSYGKFSNIELQKGTAIRLAMPGGGGWGDPRERDPELVRRDVAEELLSVDAAREIYGVVIGDGGEVDLEATAAVRRRAGEGG